MTNTITNKMTDTTSYYVLAVAKDATMEVIRKQFCRLVLVTHPDKMPQDVKAATVRFQLLQRAVDTLELRQEGLV